LDVFVEVGYDFDQDTARDGTSLLMAAVGHQDSTCVLKLLQAGVDVDMLNKYGQAALHRAADSNDSFESLRALVAYGANVSVASNDGITPLHRAAICGADQCLQFLLEHGAVFDVKSGAGDTPLQFAVGRRVARCVWLLLQVGASDEDGSAKKWLNDYNFCAAVRANDVNAARELLAAGADVDNQAEEVNQFPLYIAASSNGCREVLCLLVEAGAKLDILCRGAGYTTMTPLMAAMHANEVECVHLLLRAGAVDPNNEAKKWLAARVPEEAEEEGW